MHSVSALQRLFLGCPAIRTLDAAFCSSLDGATLRALISGDSGGAFPSSSSAPSSRPRQPLIAYHGPTDGRHLANAPLEVLPLVSPPALPLRSLVLSACFQISSQCLLALSPLSLLQVSENVVK